MAFKHQKLTKEDAKYINSFKLPYPYGGGNVLLEFDDEDSTYIDRERKIYFIIAGGLGEIKIECCPPMVCYIIMEDELVKFTCFWKYKLNNPQRREYVYLIKTIDASVAFKDKNMDEKIVDIIKEALEDRMIRYDEDKYGCMLFGQVAEPKYVLD